MPLNRNLWRAARAAVVVGLAVAGYLFFIPQTKVDRQQLGSLVISRTAVPGVPAKARVSQSVDPSRSTFSVTKAAARHDPDHTGLFAREWYVTSGAPPEAGIVIQLLPDDDSARRVAADVVKSLYTLPVLQGETARPAERFDLAGVPGGLAAAFALADSAVPAKGIVGYAYKTVYRVGRVVVTELVEDTLPRRSPGPVGADARAGRALLQREEPGFSLIRSHVPSTASIVYGVVALVVVVGAVILPEWVASYRGRRREHREQRARERDREQYLARGRRTVKRGAAPPWAQPKKR